MVERGANEPAIDPDGIFHGLAYPTRRQVLEQPVDGPETLGGRAQPHDVSLAGVSKPPRVLEDAGVIGFE